MYDCLHVSYCLTWLLVCNSVWLVIKDVLISMDYLAFMNLLLRIHEFVWWVRVCRGSHVILSRFLILSTDQLVWISQRHQNLDVTCLA
jgi:hypothetical protein